MTMSDSNPTLIEDSYGLLSDYPASDARILLVEDNSTNQLVAQKMLEKLGYQCHVAVNGQAALAALQEVSYDLLLMDCQMPELDGISTTRRIRAGESGCTDAQVPIIAMTAFAMTCDRERCLEAGMNAYLSKPVQLRQLAEMLGRWLPWRRAVTVEDADPCAVQTAGQDVPAVFDRAAFLDRLMGDEAVARTICSGFFDDMPVQISKLTTAMTAGDLGQVVLHAHRIKGAAANVGGDALQAVALAIEAAAERGALTAAGQLLGELEHGFSRLRLEMLAYFFPERSEN
jgi:CheY-like chemotaxis protein/HPt (histidine-containing phosphotransfer) domain-containing protein